MNLSKKLFNNELILNTLEQNVFVKDLDSIYLFVNNSYAKLIGKNPSQIIGKNDFDLFSTDIAKKCRKEDALLFKNKKSIETEKEIFVKNKLKIIKTIKKPLYIDGNIVALVGIFWDITEQKQEEQNYKKLSLGLKEAQALAHIGHWELDFIADRLYWSDEVYRIFGLKPQVFNATYEAFLEHIHPDDTDFVNEKYLSSLKDKIAYSIEHRIVRENGEIGFVQERCKHEYDSDGNPVRSIGTVHDITKQKNAQNELFLASAVFEKMNDGVLITDPKKRIIMINNAFSKISGYTFEEIKGKTPSIFSSGWNDSSLYKEIWNDIDKKNKWDGEIINRKKDGTIYTANLIIIALYDDNKILTNYISITNDISDMKKQEKLIHNLAYYDFLTALPNRILFEEHVLSKIPKMERYNKKMALFFIDMDNFKNINDTLGHFAGDKFLVEVVKSIKGLIRKQDTFARFGGDEFAILIEDIDIVVNIIPLANKIINKFSMPVDVDGAKLYSGISMGISIFPDDAKTYEGLIKAADTAMYQVKNSGKQNYKFYSKSMNEEIMERVLIENDLHNAIDNGEFFLVYQPKINLNTKSVYGMEALIRWNHSKNGLIGPEKFINIAENTGQIQKIGLWVAKQAFIDTKKIHDKGNMLTVSINVSSKQLENKSFIKDIYSMVSDIGIDISYVELEITESHIMNNVEKTMLILKELHEIGFKIAIDDFGTGYSSLSYLKKIPAKTIKIDSSFVLDIDKDEDDRSIVATIIAIAKSLGKDVIAEGSETKEHIKTLKSLHCNQVQGYYFSKPLKIEDFKIFIYDFKGQGKSV
ncbi:MAG: EAL domain-containing protein [Sulfurimonas sp.]|nr:EAL domain-containing protein [Sulfurimonas sp.]